MIKKVFSIALAAMVTILSCKDDNKPIFEINEFEINTDNYTNGEVVFMVSTDGGNTFSTNIPTSLEEGQTITVRATDGLDPLDTELFDVDYSACIPEATSIDGADATFKVEGSAISVKVVIEDIQTLVAVNKGTAVFHTVDMENKSLTAAFTVTENGDPLTDIRSFIYNRFDKNYYITRNTKSGGGIYSVDPATSAATSINDNADNDWDAIADLVLMSNGDLLGNMWVNNDPGGHSLAQIKTTGEVGTINKIFDNTNDDICCGMGTIQVKGTNNYMIGDQNLKVHMVGIDGQGETLQYTLDPDFTDVVVGDVVIKSLTQNHDGTVLGLLFNWNDSKSYLVAFDTTNKIVSKVMALEKDGETNFQALKYIPKYTL